MILARVARKSIEPFRDPEWQAWAFAGALLMPPRTLVMLPAGTSLDQVADLYGVSTAFARSHLRRVKMAVRGCSSLTIARP